MELINHLKWRYATKKFDPNRKVGPEDLAKIQEAVQLSASSYGLQLYKVLVIEDAALRAKLRPMAWGQSQITDASHLFVFCNYAVVKDEDIYEFVRLRATTQGVDEASLKGYGDFIVGKLGEQTAEQKSHWTARQTYIALGNLLAACAALGIDACPMEGFEPGQVNELLGLGDRGLNAAVLATIGYRSEEDQTQHAPKVRKPLETLFEVH